MTPLAEWWERESHAALKRLRDRLSRSVGQHKRYLRAATVNGNPPPTSAPISHIGECDEARRGATHKEQHGE